MKTVKECLSCQEVRLLAILTLKAFFIYNQAIVLSELTHELVISTAFCLCG